MKYLKVIVSIMEEDSLNGVIYLKYEGAKKPMPLIHLPKDLDHKIVERLNERIMEFFENREDLKTKKVEILDLNAEAIKAVFMFDKWKGEEKYWGEANTIITLLTTLSMKKIEEKISQLNPIFNKYLNRVIKLEKAEKQKEEYLKTLQDFKIKLISS
ncbi:MAG: hypothetical protein ACOCT9_02925 [archaeon]